MDTVTGYEICDVCSKLYKNTSLVRVETNRYNRKDHLIICDGCILKADLRSIQEEVKQDV